MWNYNNNSIRYIPIPVLETLFCEKRWSIGIVFSIIWCFYLDNLYICVYFWKFLLHYFSLLGKSRLSSTAYCALDFHLPIWGDSKVLISIYLKMFLQTKLKHNTDIVGVYSLPPIKPQCPTICTIIEQILKFPCYLLLTEPVDEGFPITSKPHIIPYDTSNTCLVLHSHRTFLYLPCLGI